MTRKDVHAVAARDGIAAFLLGFGLAGLFDALLLHHLLGWHHLTGPGHVHPQDLWIEAGFHIVMGLVALVGLALLLRDRQRLRLALWRRPMGSALSGFGWWHIVDAVVVHWLLRLHRVHPQAESPLVWDLVWLVGFGILPVLLGHVVRLRAELA